MGLLLCDKRLFIVAYMLVLFIFHKSQCMQVIWAVNAGGSSHTDVHGIKYQKDKLSSGFPSDYGTSLIIQRVVPQDQILYQTERYHTDNFAYDIPIKVKDEGEYVLVLKFCEVWFNAVNQKVFSVNLNDVPVISDLDIFGRVGRGVAHDEVIPFKIKNGRLLLNGDSAVIEGSSLSLEFIKGHKDNPKVNAMFLMKGSLEDVPLLPPLPNASKPDEEEEDDLEEAETEKKPSKPRRPSGPKIADPYASEDSSSMLLPVLAAIAAFLPLLFCLCKL